MDDQAAKATGPQSAEQGYGHGPGAPTQLPSHLVLVSPNPSLEHGPGEGPVHLGAQATAEAGQTHPARAGERSRAVDPRERAAAAAAAAATAAQTAAPTAAPTAGSVAGPAASNTPAAGTTTPGQSTPPSAPAAHAPTPPTADDAPVSRWAYAGMARASATSTDPDATRSATPCAASSTRPSPSRPTAAAAGTARATPAPGRAPTPATGNRPTRTQTSATAVTSAPSQQADRASFLRRTEVETPARHGWRGTLNRIGLKVAPSADERAERADIAAVAAHWAGHRTVAVVNGKGGSSKSPTTALLCAAFARHGGTGVVAWENKQTRGTLGWRTEQGPHDATLLDLMPAVPDLLSRQAGLGDFAAYTHHQIADRYAVLRAQPKSLADEQRISPDDVTAVHEIAAKFNRLIVMDSGNDESDPMWRRMIDHTDQLVVPTTTRDDHAEAAALLLEGLARGDAHRARLAAGAVVVVSQADRSAGQADLDRVADGFADLAREVVTVRFDPAMVDGVLRWDTLAPATQRDWLRAGAAVARGL